jgi:decaprenyl-phosphate phosphoribosyltransferase
VVRLAEFCSKALRSCDSVKPLNLPREPNAVNSGFEPNLGNAATAPQFRGHLAICRFDHWVKNIFVVPGAIAALAFSRTPLTSAVFLKLILGLLASGFIASSNYVLNEVLDAPFDRSHPIKQKRPVPSGLVHIPLAYVQWIVLCAAGLALGYLLSLQLLLTLFALWCMGCVYNIPPVRSKDIPFLDVLTEAINNPLRLLIGWFTVTQYTVPPVSLVVSYWMIGCYFMALKRYSELLRLSASGCLREYRKSLASLTPEAILISVMFYAASSMLFFGAFLMRYRMSLILTFPLIAWVMAVYLSIAFKKDGAAENPEKLYREKRLMMAVASCTIFMVLLMFYDVPWLYRIFEPTVIPEHILRGQ